MNRHPSNRRWLQPDLTGHSSDDTHYRSASYNLISPARTASDTQLRYAGYNLISPASRDALPISTPPVTTHLTVHGTADTLSRYDGHDLTGQRAVDNHRTHAG